MFLKGEQHLYKVVPNWVYEYFNKKLVDSRCPQRGTKYKTTPITQLETNWVCKLNCYHHPFVLKKH